MSFNVTLDPREVKRFERALLSVSFRDIPKAVSKALTNTAIDATKSVRRVLKDSLNVPDKTAFRGVRFDGATMKDMRAFVGITSNPLAKKIDRANDHKAFPAGTIVGLPRAKAKTTTRLKVEPLSKILARKKKFQGVHSRPFVIKTKSGWEGVVARTDPTNKNLPVTALFKVFKVGRRGVFDFEDIVNGTVNKKFLKHAGAAIREFNGKTR